jgi:deoxyribodipyrimidine photo-lyase
MKPKVVIHWFRRDLRLEDNTALYEAGKSGFPVLPIFIFDVNILDKLESRADARVQFIHSTLQHLQAELKKIGSGIQFFYTQPEKAWQALNEQYDIQGVFFNRDYEPYARDRDMEVYQLLKDKSIPIHTSKDHVIFEKNEVVKDDGKPYTVYTPYSRKWKSTLEKFPFVINPLITDEQWFKFNPDEIPTLESMKFQTADIDFPSDVLNETILSKYHETRDIPSINGTSKISLHLRFGTISIRNCVKIGMAQNEKWLNELIWRDFYQAIIFHFPHSATSSFKPQYDRIIWRNNEAEFKSWCDGKTGYPIVDAGMRELNKTGHMHNRVRMVVASFLTKHLLIDWRWGERYFAQKLLDFELASNVGGWQWAAGSGCDAAPYFRIFNPYNQTEKFDKEEKYIKRWVPEYQTSLYPKPIVDHAFARDRCLKTYKEALQ